MPVFVGPGSAPDGGFEGKSDRVGFPTATSNPGSAVLGDMFLHTVGAGATLMMHDGTEFVKADGSGSIFISGGTKSTVGSDTLHTFTSPGNFVVTSGSNPAAKLLIVAGGGTGGGGQIWKLWRCRWRRWCSVL